ncbi:MAG: hypothetical protein AAF351_13275 [Pseudomonadota bacterium]
MRTRLLITLIGLFSAPVLAADYAGIYMAQTPDGVVRLTLEKSGTGRYDGTLSIDDYPLQVVGAIRGARLQGELNDNGDIYDFEAELLDGSVLLQFAPDDFIILESVEPASANHKSSLDVSVNGQALTQQQVQSLAAYGIKMEPGHYWYDPACGAWGIWGGPTAGFIQAGIPVPTLPAHASQGMTNVYINGRNIPQSELTYLSALAQGPIYPGNYWLDANGNAGVVGGPALINFLHAAQQDGSNAWYGDGSSGWSSADGQSGGVWISNPYGGTGTTVTY